MHFSKPLYSFSILIVHFFRKHLSRIVKPNGPMLSVLGNSTVHNPLTHLLPHTNTKMGFLLPPRVPTLPWFSLPFYLPFSPLSLWLTAEKKKSTATCEQVWGAKYLYTRGIWATALFNLLNDGTWATACCLWAREHLCVCVHLYKIRTLCPGKIRRQWQVTNQPFEYIYYYYLCCKIFLNWFCWEVTFPSETQRKTNIRCACFFSILRNYMQMTLRSISHIGFHFTNGWLYVNSECFSVVSLATCSLCYWRAHCCPPLLRNLFRNFHETYLFPQLSCSQWCHLSQCPASLVTLGLLLTLGLQCDGSEMWLER